MRVQHSGRAVSHCTNLPHKTSLVVLGVFYYNPLCCDILLGFALPARRCENILTVMIYDNIFLRL